MADQNSDSARYIDPETGRVYPVAPDRWRSDDGAPLEVAPLAGVGRAGIDAGVRSLWRYAAALAFTPDRPITLGEGMTPLVRASLHGAAVRLKLEWFSPTGSFKDRGASVLLSMLRQWGVGEVLEDSSGNGGAAIAAYAAAGGMKARILAPASTQPGKLVQVRAYGARLDLLDATRDEVAAEALRQSREVCYASHNWHPMFLEGAKTLAYELWEDLGFRAPDNVVVPVGGGSNVLGCDIGFGELLRRGEIERMPRLFAVQPANCSPLHEAQESGRLPRDYQPRPTIAEGAAIARPVRGARVLGAVTKSGGAILAVSEEEILTAFRDLAALGFYVEPTSALAGAGFRRLVETGAVRAGDETVLVLTGGGTKATDRIRSLLAER